MAKVPTVQVKHPVAGVPMWVNAELADRYEPWTEPDAPPKKAPPKAKRPRKRPKNPDKD